MISNLGFVNIIVVIARLRWFNKRLKEAGIHLHIPFTLQQTELIW
jgi:regulator of protease activity HflC (stomatin/prohibitin superfamily)